MDVKQTKKILADIPTDKSVMLVAKHGVGKSSVVKQVAKDAGIGFHDVRLSQCEVGDIKGLPYLNSEEQRTEFLKPYWWPRDMESKGILFFDELNRASKDVLQAVFEICLDRRLDGVALPAGWRVVAAINASDDYDVVELDPALLDRWFVIDFDPSAKEWISWATKSGIHPSVVEFLLQNEDLLDPPVGNLTAGQVYPSRRSWSQFNDTVSALELWNDPDEGLLTQICKGWLGSKVATTFPRFLLHDYARLRPDDIIEKLEDIRPKIEAAAADIESIATLSKAVLLNLGKRTAASLKDKHKENVKEFIQMLPKDVVSQFWSGLLEIKAMKRDIVDWQKDDKFRKFIAGVYCS